MRTVTIRVRSIVWFATGALLAAAVAVIVGQAWRVDADSEQASQSVFVPIDPCRLIDTRPGPDNLGAYRWTSIDDNSFFDRTNANLLGFNAASGFIGDPCIRPDGQPVVPNEASAVVLNVTALNATEQTFVSFFPGDQRPGPGEDPPLVASLNPAPGQPPTPNAVTVKTEDGSAYVYAYADSGFSSLELVIDVYGYYLPPASP